MKTNEKILADLHAKSKNFDLLIKSFNLSIEKTGVYKYNASEKPKAKKPQYV